MLAALGVFLAILAVSFGFLSFMVFTSWVDDNLVNIFPYKYLTAPFLTLAFIFGVLAIFLYFYISATH
jgi:hypothetical protein